MPDLINLSTLSPSVGNYLQKILSMRLFKRKEFILKNRCHFLVLFFFFIRLELTRNGSCLIIDSRYIWWYKNPLHFRLFGSAAVTSLFSYNDVTSLCLGRRSREPKFCIWQIRKGKYILNWQNAFIAHSQQDIRFWLK